MSSRFRLPARTPVLITKPQAVELCQEFPMTHEELRHLKVRPNKLLTHSVPNVRQELVSEPTCAGRFPVPLPRSHQSVLHYRIPTDRAVFNLLGRQLYNPRHTDRHPALDPVRRPPPPRLIPNRQHSCQYRHGNRRRRPVRPIHLQQNRPLGRGQLLPVSLLQP
ncbi:unnamed protein product, partial [Nesidiocoris tenuis]